MNIEPYKIPTEIMSQAEKDYREYVKCISGVNPLSLGANRIERSEIDIDLVTQLNQEDPLLDALLYGIPEKFLGPATDNNKTTIKQSEIYKRFITAK